MRVFVVKDHKGFHAITPDMIERDDQFKAFRVTYWTRRPDEQPLSFSYWKIQGLFRPDTGESYYFSGEAVRSSHWNRHVSAYNVSPPEFQEDKSILFRAICELIERGQAPSAIESKATDVFSALEWSHLSQVRELLERGSLS